MLRFDVDGAVCASEVAMSEFSFTCQGCGAGLSADETTAGAVTACPECGKPLVVPKKQRNSPFMSILCLLLAAIVAVYAYSAGYSYGVANGIGSGYSTGFSAGRKDGYATGVNLGQKNGHAEGYRLAFAECEAKVGSAAKEAGFADGYRQGWTDGEKKGQAESEKKGFADGQKAGSEAGQKTGFADGYRQGLAEGDTRGQTTGKQVGYLDGMRYGLSEGEAKGMAAGKKLGHEEGYQLGWAEGEKAVWGVLNMKAGTPEGSVLKWLGKPDKEEGFVGERALTLIYGNVRIRVVAAYDGTRKVDQVTGDLKALLESRLSDNPEKASKP